MILHLIDASDEDRWQRVRQVNTVLKQLEADGVPQIRVYNKIDKLDRLPRVTSNRKGEGRAVWLSAVSGEGIPLLLDTIADRLRRATINGTIRLLADQGRQRALLFEMGAVTRETAISDGGWELDVVLEAREFERFLKRGELKREILQPAITTSPRLATQR